MKPYFATLLIMMSAFVFIGKSQCEDFSFSLEVYPKTIYYGDIIFSDAKVKNLTDGNLKVVQSRSNGYIKEKYFLRVENAPAPCLKWYNKYEYDDNEHTIEARADISFPIITKDVNCMGIGTFSFRPLWVPPPNVYYGDNFRSNFSDILTKNSKRFTLEVIREDCYVTKPFVPEALRKELNLTCSFEILPRSQEEYDLLQQWYKAIPAAQIKWRDFEVLFQIGNHTMFQDNVSDIGNVRTKNWFQKRKEFYDESINDTFMILCVKTAKELESQILKRADSPNSTISQNMKEFIKLRGYLVDIRFAENVAEEEKAFNNFVTFIEQSKDKELWIRFVIEIAFDSIIDNEHFPHEKVQNYRKRFVEKFAVKTGVNE